MNPENLNKVVLLYDEMRALKTADNYLKCGGRAAIYSQTGQCVPITDKATNKAINDCITARMQQINELLKEM